MLVEPPLCCLLGDALGLTRTKPTTGRGAKLAHGPSSRDARFVETALFGPAVVLDAMLLTFDRFTLTLTFKCGESTTVQALRRSENRGRELQDLVCRVTLLQQLEESVLQLLRGITLTFTGRKAIALIEAASLARNP